MQGLRFWDVGLSGQIDLPNIFSLLSIHLLRILIIFVQGKDMAAISFSSCRSGWIGAILILVMLWSLWALKPSSGVEVVVRCMISNLEVIE